MNAKIPSTNVTHDEPEFLAHHREHEIRMRVRQHVLDPALTRPAPQQPAIPERLERRVNLVVVAGRRVDESA